MEESAAYSIDFLDRLERKTGLVLLGTLHVPLIGWFLSLVPPWPAQAPVVAFSIATQLIVVMSLSGFLWQPRKTQWKRIFLFSTALVCVSLFAYLTLATTFTAKLPDSKDRIVTGFALTVEAEFLQAELQFSQQELLHAVGYDANTVWTRSSIIFVSGALLASWLVFVCSLTVAALAIIRLQQVE